MKPDSEAPNDFESSIRRFLSARISRRQVLKASLIGAGGLAVAAKGLAPLEIPGTASASGGGWRQLTPKTTPSPRVSAAMAYDAARRTTVLFSGYSQTPEADTWTWDGFTWTRQNPPLSPPARSGASFVYHPPTQKLVLFGGDGPGGRLGDTWLWDGKNWSPVSNASPPNRSGASMAFDPVTSSIILFGGFAGGDLGDTWKWDGTSWHALSTTGSTPGHLSGAGFAYSAVVGKLILFGGTQGMGNPPSQTMWAWDGSNWSQVLLNPSPQGRSYAAMAASLDSRLILLFGGHNSNLLGDTWALTSTWSQDTRTPAPSPRVGAALAPDPSGTSLLLFGGGDGYGGLMGDAWAWVS